MLVAERRFFTYTTISNTLLLAQVVVVTSAENSTIVCALQIKTWTSVSELHCKTFVVLVDVILLSWRYTEKQRILS